MKTTQTYYYPRKQGEDILTYTKRTKANTSYLQELREGGFNLDDNYFYKKYAPKVTHWVTVALSKNNLMDYIDDVKQEVWLKVKTYEANYDPAKPFEGWLNVITQSVIADTLNEINSHRAVHQSYEESIELGFDVIDEEAGSPEEVLDQKQQIVEFMKFLSPQEGMVATLVMDGATYGEIQAELELTSPAIKTTVERIRAKAETFFNK